MEDYLKVKRIQKLSCLVSCLNRFSSQNIEIILISIHLIIIILCVMNLFIIPWEEIVKSLWNLRLVIIIFLAISLLFIILTLIFQKQKKLKTNGFYYISFFGSLFSCLLIILDFLFIFISLIIVYRKIKKNETKTNYTSVLTIDIFTLLIFIPIFFFWYAVILNIYARINSDESLKDYIESKIRFFMSQNAKIVNVELGQDKKIYNDVIIEKNLDNIDEIISNNKIEMSAEKPEVIRKGHNTINNSASQNN